MPKVTPEEEKELIQRFYSGGLAREKAKQERLDARLFVPPESRIKLKSKEDWDAWHASMARDTRQKIRLPPDQLYYGKPSPRDRGHF